MKESEFKEFCGDVKEMRRLQKVYFRTREFNVLKAAKQQEKKVDDAIRNMDLTPDNQSTLF